MNTQLASELMKMAGVDQEYREDPDGLDERRKKLSLPPASYKYDFKAAERADKEGTAFSS